MVTIPKAFKMIHGLTSISLVPVERCYIINQATSINDTSCRDVHSSHAQLSQKLIFLYDKVAHIPEKFDLPASPLA